MSKTAWNHHTTAGAFRLAKVALRVLQEKGALNLSPEALSREVVDVVYEQAPVESNEAPKPAGRKIGRNKCQALAYYDGSRQPGPSQSVAVTITAEVATTASLMDGPRIWDSSRTRLATDSDWITPSVSAAAALLAMTTGLALTATGPTS